ncbi:Thiolase-like protein [Cynara cardunculus var. scolymus]|uniref:Thiolase-like protein n=2 Tax=Cynara cardunculus var. scolymus TaxID=59895 RepID=A0A103XGC2_CYNCS|nr:Thiolase-like protein [Cynara cardunculus var. scolymus]
MANASGFLTPTMISSSIGINRSGFFNPDAISKRVRCSTTSQGVESFSPPESRVPNPRLVSKGCKLVGCGSAVPQLQISNDDLAKIVDTNDEWISARTGIRNRRILTGNESLTGLAVEAAQKALQMAEVEPDDVDLILLCTSTAEDLFGGAPQIQKALGCKGNPLAFDITAACSGFLLGLVSAS